MKDRELYQKILGLEEPRRVDDVERLLDSGEIRVRISHPPDPKGNLLSRPAALASPALGLVWDFDNRLRGADTNGSPAAVPSSFAAFSARKPASRVTAACLGHWLTRSWL